ncbi:glycosyltransferase family 10 [uncultured Desulfovibrio sp.]|uniref:glycosyltransferase family 10 domain-containing protein n=1 Tax=uncultured Desulfovibrio sp. TaxID=167968 RepID=UPI0026727998|nr:glycosyltransferase family 10 [uncultured Desulfovibrio sp.]
MGTIKDYCTFATMHLPWPWMRQTIDGNGQIGSTCFLLNRNSSLAQWLAVVDEPPAAFNTFIPKVRRILFITEPPEVKVWPKSYLRQFGYIVSPYTIRGAQGETRLLRENPCLTWHLGVHTSGNAYTSNIKDLVTLWRMSPPEKTRQLSVICSTKTFTPTQHKRIAFVEKLQAQYGEAVDIYGRGRNPISDKGQAILPYKYHLVLENSLLDNFWTEKLSDAWLGYAYPIYLGASNIERCCPPGGLLTLQPDSDEANLMTIERLLQDDPWERCLPAIRECRRWVLETTNVFARVDRLIQEAAPYIRAVPNLDKPVPLRQSSRWQRALLRRAMRFGLYNPFA